MGLNPLLQNKFEPTALQKAQVDSLPRFAGGYGVSTDYSLNNGATI
jgi:hypothetical protein